MCITTTATTATKKNAYIRKKSILVYTVIVSKAPLEMPSADDCAKGTLSRCRYVHAKLCENYVLPSLL